MSTLWHNTAAILIMKTDEDKKATTEARRHREKHGGENILKSFALLCVSVVKYLNICLPCPHGYCHSK